MSDEQSFLRNGLKRAVLLSIVMLVVSGVVYRCIAAWLGQIDQKPITLQTPLSQFPTQVGPWKGEDVSISEAELKVAGNDDYLSRLYVDDTTKRWAYVYVAYTATPRTMLGHRPQVCLPSSGWINDSSEKSTFTTVSGREVECLLHRFHRPAPSTDQTVVINFYILNGKITNDEDKFAGVKFRLPNIDGNAARYVTQVRVSSVVENSVRAAAKDLTDLIISFFPDENELNSKEQTADSKEPKAEERKLPDPALGRQ